MSWGEGGTGRVNAVISDLNCFPPVNGRHLLHPVFVVLYRGVRHRRGDSGFLVAENRSNARDKFNPFFSR